MRPKGVEARRLPHADAAAIVAAAAVAAADGARVPPGRQRISLERVWAARAEAAKGGGADPPPNPFSRGLPPVLPAAPFAAVAPPPRDRRQAAWATLRPALGAAPFSAYDSCVAAAAEYASRTPRSAAALHAFLA